MIWEMLQITPLMNTESIPTFLSKMVFANNPIVFTASDNKSHCPLLYFNTHFIKFTSIVGREPLLTISRPSSTFPLFIARHRTFNAHYTFYFLWGLRIMVSGGWRICNSLSRNVGSLRSYEAPYMSLAYCSHLFHTSSVLTTFLGETSLVSIPFYPVLPASNIIMFAPLVGVHDRFLLLLSRS